MNKILPLLISALILLSCISDSDQLQTEDPSISHFKSSIFEIGDRNAIIVWDEAETLNSENASYSILLNNKEIISNLKGVTYTFKDLVPHTYYEGVIKAIDSKGNKSIAPFTFKTAGVEKLSSSSSL